jgi:hypothetical protein
MAVGLNSSSNVAHKPKDKRPTPVAADGASPWVRAARFARVGADVTAVESTGKLDMLRSIGADQVIDYTQADFTKS